MKNLLSWRRTASAFALSALVLSAARAQDADKGDPAASAAARAFLGGKGLKTAKLPAEQWLGEYAGCCWTGAVRISLAETDEAAAGLRRFSIERITSHEKESPAHSVESWWVDSEGAIVRGEREAFKDGGDSEGVIKWQLKAGKLRTVDEPGNPDATTMDLPGAFLPDELLAVTTLPKDTGKTYRFSLPGGEGFTVYTVEDKGEEKIRARSGEVSARKLVVKSPEGESNYFVDEQHRILLVTTPKTPNLTSVGGTETEARADWWARPKDDADAAADRLLQKVASLEALVGELTYGVCDKEGRATAVVSVKLVKETRDGKPAFHYTSTVAPVASGDGTSLEEWWLTPEGRPISGDYTITVPGVDEKTEVKARIDGDKLVGTSSEEDSEEVVTIVPPRFTCDVLLLMKAFAQEEKGTFRFNTYDFDTRRLNSVLIEVKAKEKIALRSGSTEAKRIFFMQNTGEAYGWIDAKGALLLARWEENGDLNVAGSLEESRKDLTGPVGPPAAKSE